MAKFLLLLRRDVYKRQALDGASSFIRSKLAERIDIRHTPELKFIYDTSIAVSYTHLDVYKRQDQNQVLDDDIYEVDIYSKEKGEK